MRKAQDVMITSVISHHWSLGVGGPHMVELRCTGVMHDGLYDNGVERSDFKSYQYHTIVVARDRCIITST
jgi:hypothetical protein